MFIKFSELALEYNESVKEVQYGDKVLEVKQYLPQEEKGALIKFVLESALDPVTNVFSPLRLDIYFAIAVAAWYMGIEFSEEDLNDAGKLYDILETNGINQLIVNNVPAAEYEDVQRLVAETAADMAKFNTSFVGVMNNLQNSNMDINSQLEDILSKIKDENNLSLIKEIREIGQM